MMMSSMTKLTKECDDKKHAHLILFVQIYAGYVDDPRNTDNAWMETVAVNFHDETGTIYYKIKQKTQALNNY